MPSKYRIVFLLIFTVFFVITSCVITIYSLGYEIDFEEKSLKNKVSMSIDTKPGKVQIYSNGVVVENSEDFSASDNALTSVNIKKDGYLDENYLIWSAPEKNTYINIDNLYLLPKDYREIDSMNEKTTLSILSENYILFKGNDNKYYIQLFNFGGLQGKPELINSNNKEYEISSQRWIEIYENIFWSEEKNLLIYKKDSNWNFFDLSELFFKTEEIVVSNDSNLIILDDSKNLWSLDLNNYTQIQDVYFAGSNVDGITGTETPNNIWMWKGTKIYKIPRNDMDSNFIQRNLSDYLYAENGKFYKPTQEYSRQNKFQVKPAHQGIVIKTYSDLYYLADFNKNAPQNITSDAMVIGVEGDTAFWLSQNKQLFAYNIKLNDNDSFDTIPLEGDFDTLRISFASDWNRIMLYSETDTYSVWYDRFTINEGIVKYSNNHWIENSSCYSSVYEKSQFCITNNKLVLYQNKSIF